MTFSICTLIHCYQGSAVKAEEISLLSVPQMVTGAIDIVGIVGVVAFAILLLSNSAHSHPLGLTPSNGPYILLGGAGGAALVDMIALAVQTCKKFKTLTTVLKETNQRIDVGCQAIRAIIQDQ